MNLLQIRMRYEKKGGHIHCRVFTAPGINQTFAKCGDLVFDEREWPAVMRRFNGVIEMIEDYPL